MDEYYKKSITTLLNSEDYPPEVLGFVYWLLLKVATDGEEELK